MTGSGCTPTADGRHVPTIDGDQVFIPKLNLGTIHILLKHLYSTKLNLISKIFTKAGFFRQNKRSFFQHYILTKFSCCSLKFSVHKEEEKY